MLISSTLVEDNKKLKSPKACVHVFHFREVRKTKMRFFNVEYNTLMIKQDVRCYQTNYLRIYLLTNLLICFFKNDDFFL